MRWIHLLFVASVAGCGSGSDDAGVAADGSGGEATPLGTGAHADSGASGSRATVGGAPGTGGASGTVGATSTGGATGTGGAPGTGGASGRGGSPVPVDAGAPGTWVDISPFGFPGAFGVAVSPAAPGTVYVNVNAKDGWPPGDDPKSGIFKSTDGGNSWGSGPIGTVFKNLDGSSYKGVNPWQQGVSWTIAVDPTDANVVYAHCSFAGPQGPWKSTDGGNTWQYLFSSTDNSNMTPDVYAITIDPRDHLHVLITFHSPWAQKGGGGAGIAESTDGGGTWTEHAPRATWGQGHYVFFLEQDDAKNPSSKAWILATQSDGFWRTLDAGQTWTKVSSTYNMQHGAGGLYRASTGVLYMGAVGHLLRSADNGKTWSDAGAPSNSDGYNAVIGDGTRMYVQSANTGKNTTGPQTYYSSLETDGAHWAAYNSQLFADGPGWMAFDPVNRIVYASHWDDGLWRLKTR
jgi:hypothetical protein